MKKLTKQSIITFVELPPTQFGVLNGEASWDFYSGIRLPSRAIPALTGVLRSEGWTNVREINPLYHGLKRKLSNENFRRIFDSDVLLISSITRTSLQSMKLADMYKARNHDGTVIAGGPDATFRIEDWLRHVDIVVRGEGERTLKELMEVLTGETPDLKGVAGIAFNQDGRVAVTKPRQLMTAEELSGLPHPYYDETTRKKVASMVVEASRGCPNNCDFCSVSELYGRVYRQKSKECIAEELERIEKIGRYCFFSDDNIAGNPARTIELLRWIKKYSAKRKKIAQITIMAAFNGRLLKALKEAGFIYLCVGIESIVDETLKFFGKPYRANKTKEAVDIFRDNGFWVHGMMILGGDGDTPGTLRETGKWADQNLDSVQFFTPIPIPGTRFYDRMDREGRILTKDWYLYDGQHVVIRPKNLTPYQLQTIVHKMDKDFYSFKKSFRRNFGLKKMGMSMLFSFYANCRGGKFFTNPQMTSHLSFLKSLG